VRAGMAIFVGLICVVALGAERPCLGFGVSVLKSKTYSTSVNATVRAIDIAASQNDEFCPIDHIPINQFFFDRGIQIVGREPGSRIHDATIKVWLRVETFRKIFCGFTTSNAKLVIFERHGESIGGIKHVQRRLAPCIQIRDCDLQFGIDGQRTDRFSPCGAYPSALARLGDVSRGLRGFGQTVCDLGRVSGRLQLVEHDGSLPVGIVIANPNSGNADEGGGPKTDNPRMLPTAFALFLGMVLVVASVKFLLYAFDRGGYFSGAAFVFGFPLFFIGFSLIFFCFLPDPPPIFGFFVGSHPVSSAHLPL
jgi:hypothetical protein